MLNRDALKHQCQERTVYADSFGRLIQTGHSYRFQYSRTPVLSADQDAHNFRDDAEVIRQFRLCSVLAMGWSAPAAKRYAATPPPSKRSLRQEAIRTALEMIRGGTDPEEVVREIGNTDRFMPLYTGMEEEELHRYLYAILRMAEHMSGIR